MRKTGQEDEKTLAGLSSAHRCLQEKCKLAQTTYIKRIQFFLHVCLIRGNSFTYMIHNSGRLSYKAYALEKLIRIG